MKHILFLFLLAVAEPAFAQTATPINEIIGMDEGNCISQLGYRGTDDMIIKSDAELQSSIRQDASKERCQAFFSEKNIPFQTHMLVGVSIYSGSCSRPLDLKAELQTDYAEARSVLVVSYASSGMMCKAFKRHAAWYMVPIPVEGFAFEVKQERIEAKDEF